MFTNTTFSSRLMTLACDVLHLDAVEIWSDRSGTLTGLTRLVSVDSLNGVNLELTSARKLVCTRLCNLADNSDTSFHWESCCGESSEHSTMLAHCVNTHKLNEKYFVVGMARRKISNDLINETFLKGISLAMCVAAIEFDSSKRSKTSIIDSIDSKALGDSSAIELLAMPDVCSVRSSTVSVSIASASSSPITDVEAATNSVAQNLVMHDCDGSSTLPSWRPAASFSYPVACMPDITDVNNDLQLSEFVDMTFVVEGTNAHIFTARRQGGDMVVLKVIKQEAILNSVAVREFEMEHGILGRVSHPNIVKLLGGGKTPRQFVVLEYLSGGTLQDLLNKHKEVPGGFVYNMFRKPSFTFKELLIHARELADALDYLHRSCHQGATIIHRGHLKLLDFGLCACVKSTAGEGAGVAGQCVSYAMTGSTGSPRYMAPEVTLKQPYTEKADVYSFAVLVWQMGRDRSPYSGLSRRKFLDRVVHHGARPKLNKSWPKGFQDLLSACWHGKPGSRPSFQEVLTRLDSLISPV